MNRRISLKHFVDLKKNFFCHFFVKDRKSVEHREGIKIDKKKSDCSLRRGKIELSNDIKIMCWNTRYMCLKSSINFFQAHENLKQITYCTSKTRLP